jgi:peptidoglycan/LPS O-acetylase OafA/YrhL
MNNFVNNFTNKRNHLDALLALRGFACLMVVIIHCNPPRNSIIYKGYDLSWLSFSHGMVAVWVFFCLSGYLMGKSFYAECYSADVNGVIDDYHSFARNKKLSFSSVLKNPIRLLKLFDKLSFLIYIYHTPILSRINSIFTSYIAR